MGVWIEICYHAFSVSVYKVTPCVGVWIEIYSVFSAASCCARSLPAWECGLKLNFVIVASPKILSLPAWECGLKCKHLKMVYNNCCHSLRGSVD